MRAVLAGPVFDDAESRRFFVFLVGVPVSVFVAAVVAWLATRKLLRGGHRAVRFLLVFLVCLVVSLFAAYAVLLAYSGSP
jgi:hypothetical protein